jgi:transcription-repair coupling factor (superfamily II helicase)
MSLVTLSSCVRRSTIAEDHALPDLKTILSAKSPLTLAGVPAGFQPALLADLARAAAHNGKGARAVFIAPDDAAMRAVAATAAFFAPELEVISFPAWDCLPYDRASPTLRIMAERIAALWRLQKPAKTPQLVLTTANAATQRVLTPFRIRQLVATLEPGARIDRDDRARLLQANGYVRTETVHDQGEYAVRT